MSCVNADEKCVCTCILSLVIYGPCRKYAHIQHFLLVVYHVVLRLGDTVVAAASSISVPVRLTAILWREVLNLTQTSKPSEICIFGYLRHIYTMQCVLYLEYLQKAKKLI